MTRLVDKPELTATQMFDESAIEPAERAVPADELETGVLGNGANCGWPEYSEFG